LTRFDVCVISSHSVYVCSTIASLQSSLSELNTAYVQLKKSIEAEQTKVADYKAQVTTLSSQLRGKVTVLIFHLMIGGWQIICPFDICYARL